MVARNQVRKTAGYGETTPASSPGGSVQKLTDDEIVAFLKTEISNAAGGLTTSKLSENRRSALKYYMGDPYGDELEGQSSVVTSEFRDTVESLLPSLIKIFMASDNVVRFDPEGPEDEAGAQQATDTINYVFWKENPGFIVLYTMIKDALMYKNGIVKIYRENKNKVTKETYRGLTIPQRNAVLNGENVEPIAYTEYDQESPGPMLPDGTFAPGPPEKVCDLTIKRTDTVGRSCVVPVPPDEFLISQRVASIQSAGFVAHRKPCTISELVELGVPFKEAESLAGQQAEGEYSLERQQRFSYEGDTSPMAESQDPARRPVWLHECYVLIDVDKDGIAEKWKITVAGDQSRLISKEEWEGDWPFESISPNLMQHKFYGLSIYDMVQQWQRIMSTLTRQFLNNIYGINNNRVAVNADRVNIDDFLTNRPNQLVRTLGANPNEVIMPLVPVPLGGIIIPGMEFFDTRREKATGVTSYNQGLDADSLNKTASGISQIMNAAQERILLIARIFAETGVCGIFRQLLQLECRYQNKPKTIRLRGKWVMVDPAMWNAQMNASTDVALGTNNRDQMLIHLTNVLAIQKEAYLSGLGLVTPQNIYNTLAKMVENTGLKHVESYFTDPSTQPPPPPKPSPEEIDAQKEIQLQQMKQTSSMQEETMRLNAAAREKLASIQSDQIKLRAEAEEAAKDRELQLRIAREKNLTSLFLEDQKQSSAALDNVVPLSSHPDGTPKRPEGKKQPLRFKIGRDAKGDATEIIPIYEEIIEEADPADAP